MVKRALSTVCVLLLASCVGGEQADPSDVSFRTAWLSPTGTIPSEVTELELVVHLSGEVEPQRSTFTVANLMDPDGDMRPELVRESLPYGTEIRIEVLGLVGGLPAYRGHVGPFVLVPGERRHVDLRMYPLGVSTAIEDTTLPGRILHTATSLPDGRVLVAGGFDRAEDMPCSVALPPDARCFMLHASRAAYLFAPATGRFYPVQGGMLEARGGHTATAMPDGRVVMAGGAEQALFVLLPQGAGTTGFAPSLTPMDATGTAGAHASFEVFDPALNPEAVDADRDGDPGRGGFVGSAAVATTPGLLNQARFLHAAAIIPNTGGQVLLVGGMGADDSASTYEVYDHDKPGGYGVYANVGASLVVPRVAPAAVGLTQPAPGGVWILGGAVASANEDLAEVWRPGASGPNGEVVRATEAGNYPNPSIGNLGDRPQYSLLRPDVAALNRGTHALVTGWLGPRCAPGSETPVFPMEGEATEVCGHEGGPPRGHTIAGATGLTVGTNTTAAHAFGDTTSLDDGRVVVTGGITSIVWNATPLIEVFTGSVDPSGIAIKAGSGVAMRTGRSFHRASALPGQGVLITGGMTLSTDVTRMTLVAGSEALYLQ